MVARLLLCFFAATAVRAAPLPSCSDDEGACVGEDMDLSPEGIMACLKALESRSEGCTAYLALLDGCAADLSREGVCGQAHADGETAACLIQRVQPEQLVCGCGARTPRLLWLLPLTRSGLYV